MQATYASLICNVQLSSSHIVNGKKKIGEIDLNHILLKLLFQHVVSGSHTGPHSLEVSIPGDVLLGDLIVHPILPVRTLV